MNPHFPYSTITAPVIFGQLGQKLIGHQRLVTGWLVAHHGLHMAPGLVF